MSLRTRKIILGFIFLLLVALTGAVIYFAQKASSLSGEKHSTSQKSTAVSFTLLTMPRYFCPYERWPANIVIRE
jgi:sensor domain CHASE-containing protein